MVNYGNSKIYKLVNDIDDKIYVGSTTQTLSRRKSLHKDYSKKYPNRKVYKYLNNIDWKYTHIILIEKYPCKDRIELIKRERYWYDKLSPSLNKNTPGRTAEQYLIDEKEKIKLRTAKYRINNREILRLRSKQYCINNREIINQRQKIKRTINKKEIAIKRNKKIICKCGCTINKSSMWAHMQTNKHRNLMKK